MPAPLSSQRAIRLDYCRSCRSVGSIIGTTGQCESCFKQEIYQNAFKQPSQRSLAVRRRLAGHTILFSISVWTTVGFVPMLAADMGAADHIAVFGVTRLLGLAVFVYLGAILFAH